MGAKQTTRVYDAGSWSSRSGFELCMNHLSMIHHSRHYRAYITQFRKVIKLVYCILYQSLA